MSRRMRLVPMAWLAALAAAASASTVAAAVPVVDEEQLWTYDAKGRCDPFVPLVREGHVVPCETGTQAEDGKSSTPKLGGILWDSGGHSIALINGGEAQVGDAVNGYEITDITRDEVVLTRDDERMVLRITFDESKPPKAGASR